MTADWQVWRSHLTGEWLAWDGSFALLRGFPTWREAYDYAYGKAYAS